MSIVGDVMLGRRVAQASGGRPDPHPATDRPSGCGGPRSRSATSSGPCPTDGTPTQGGDSFAADPEVLGGLERAGFDLVSLANNHVGDYGPRALRQTLDRLADADCPTSAPAATSTEARRPVVVRRDGVRVGFIGTESIGETPGGHRRPGRDEPAEHAAADRAVERAPATADQPPTSSGWRSGSTWSWCCRTGAPSTPTCPRRASDGRRAPSSRRAPIWSSAATRTGCRAGRRSGRPRGALAGQLRLRHGLPDEDDGGDLRRDRALGRRGQGGRTGRLRLDRRFVPRVVGGTRAQGILDDVWSTSRGAFARP